MTSKGRDFSAALADAQEKGFAEADPTLDIDGYDTAHKLVLLIRLAWGVDYPYTEMPIRGIRNLDRMDIEFARDSDTGSNCSQSQNAARRLEAGVFPTLVNHTYLLARVGGAFNAVRLEGNAVGNTVFARSRSRQPAHRQRGSWRSCLHCPGKQSLQFRILPAGFAPSRHSSARSGQQHILHAFHGQG